MLEEKTTKKADRKTDRLFTGCVIEGKRGYGMSLYCTRMMLIKYLENPEQR